MSCPVWLWAVIWAAVWVVISGAGGWFAWHPELVLIFGLVTFLVSSFFGARRGWIR